MWGECRRLQPPPSRLSLSSDPAGFPAAHALDQGSNAQVQAGLGALHRAIDRALSLDDQRPARDARPAGGDGADPAEARQRPGRALEARLSSRAPAPAAAGLVYAVAPDLVYAVAADLVFAAADGP